MIHSPDLPPSVIIPFGAEADLEWENAVPCKAAGKMGDLPAVPQEKEA